MDLYEALKAGTSAEDLLAKFNEELNDAQARIQEEQEAELNAQWRDECRADVVDAFMDYVDACFGDELDYDDTDDEFTAKCIEQVLLDFEDKVNTLIKANKDKVKTKTIKINPNTTAEITTCCLDDDDIIEAFLKSLK